MKKFIISILAASLLGLHAYSQSADPSVVASSGGSYEGTEMQVSWTLGETVIATISDGSTTLTQGFHQESYEIIGMEEILKNENYVVKVFPNPTENYINCEITNSKTIDNLVIRVLDAKGNQIDKKEFMDLNEKEFLSKFDLSNAVAGEYILQIMNDEYNKSFKIIKR